MYTPITPTEAPDLGNFSADQRAEYERLFLTPDVDSDGDGYTDLQELLARTAQDDPEDTPERINLAIALQPDPTIDSDGDGAPDQTEHVFGTDPWNSNSVPEQGITFVPTLAPSLETQFHKDIAALAGELNYDPVKIYRFVHDEIRFDEYEHSAKGAVATLHTRLGNEWDQAALLVALLRMSGIPCRFGLSGQWSHFQLSKDHFYGFRPMVFVQAWTSPRTQEGAPRQGLATDQVWLPLAPYLKTMRVVSPGVDLFPQTEDGNTASPLDLINFMEDYLLGAPDVSDVDGFLAHSQLTPVDFFESWLQNFFVQASCEEEVEKPECGLGRPVSLSDVPRKQEIVPFEGQSLPLSFPIGLAANIGLASPTDEAEVFDQIRERDRNFVELQLEVAAENALRYVHYPVTSADTEQLRDFGRKGNHGAYVSAPKSVAEGRLEINEESPYTLVEISPDCQCNTDDCADNAACTEDFFHTGTEERSVVFTLQVDALDSEDATIYQEGDSNNGIRIFARRVTGEEFDLFARVVTSNAFQQSGEPSHITFAGTRIPMGVSRRIGVVFDKGELIVYVSRLEQARETHPVTFYNPPRGGTFLGGPTGTSSSGRLRAGFLDDISVYHGAVQPSAQAPTLYKKVYTAQVAERRLVLDPGADSPVIDGLIDVVLRLDGTPMAPPFRDLSAMEDAIRATHQVNRAEPDRRPPIAANAMVTISYSMRSGSMARAARLAEELADIPYSVGISEEDEPLLGRFGALLAETFHYRQLETANRVDELLHIDTWHNTTTMMVWTYPDTIAADEDPSAFGLGSAFLFHPAWFVDAQGHSLGARKHHFPLAEENANPPWPEYPVLPAVVDGLRTFRNFLIDGSLSFYEAAIIEQWAGTPALSTVLGLFHAKDVIRLIQANVATEDGVAAVAEILQALGAVTVQSIVQYLQDNPSGFVLVPTTPPQRVDAENPDQVLLEVPLYAGIGPYNTSWAGNGNFNFATGQSETDETVTTVFEREIADTDNFEGDWFDSVVENGDVFYVADETLAAVHPAGDPVNLVTGEFYTEEIPDLVFPAYGELDFSVTRGYRSQAQYPGPFGYGWTWNHGESLWFENEGDLRHVHYHDSQRRDHFIEDMGGGVYQLPVGATFTFEPMGTSGDGPSQYRIKNKDGSSIVFHAIGKIEAKFDRFGNFLSFDWDLVNDRLQRIQDQQGRGIDFIYEGSSRKVSKLVCDFAPAELCTTEYRYDEETGEDLIAFINADGHQTRFEYLRDQDHPLNNHNLTKYILPNDDFLEVSYAKNDRVLSHTNSQGRTFKFRYSPLQRWSETWDEAVEWGKEGNHETIFYNSNRDVIRHDMADGTIKTMTYDGSHNLRTETDGLGRTTTYTYDDNRNLLTRTNALGEVWEWRYEDPNYPDFATYVRDPEGGIIEKIYDKGYVSREITHLTKDNALASLEMISFHEVPDTLLPGSLVAQERMAKTVTSAVPRLVVDYEYENNTFGNLRFVRSKLMGYDVENDTLAALPGLTDRDSSTIEHRYDSTGLLRVMTLDENQIETHFDHDELGRVSKTTDAAGHVVEVSYNNLHKVVERRSSFLGVVETHKYDSLNRLFRSTDAEGAVTEIHYHPARDIVDQAQVARRVDPLGYEESFEYDPVGNAISVTNANGDSKTQEYDGMRRIIRETDYAGYTTQHQYDGAGNRIASVDALGRVTQHSYDKANRRVATIDPHGRKTTFQYDKNGNLVGLTDVLGTTNYDAARRAGPRSSDHGGRES